MSRKIKKIIFPGTTLIFSIYLSIAFAIGIITGYLGTVFFHRKFIRTGKLEPLVFHWGDWNIHFHHWLMGSFGVFITYFFSSFSIFWLGFFGGLIFHDIYTDKSWYKVVYRKESNF